MEAKIVDKLAEVEGSNPHDEELKTLSIEMEPVTYGNASCYNK